MEAGNEPRNLYDHLIISNPDDTGELIGTAEVIDIRNQAADNKTFFKTVSDHLPVVARFDTSGVDDD